MLASPAERLPTVGAIDTFYEVTNLVPDASAAVDRCAAAFGLDAGAFVPIDSKHFGYAGQLTLFDDARLDRFEIITPYDTAKTMGRFFGRFGASLCMAFAETDRLAEIEERALDRRAGFTAAPPAGRRTERGAHTVFLHPASLGGMMLGLSRRTYAWSWSGHPERVEGGVESAA